MHHARVHHEVFIYSLRHLVPVRILTPLSFMNDERRIAIARKKRHNNALIIHDDLDASSKFELSAEAVED